MSKFLDQAGLQVLWEQIKQRFIDGDELDVILADYATDAELASAIAALANVYTKKEIQGSNGKARIFNEADGGGAKFEHTDGTWSFAGVNDGGKDGLAAQIYAVDSTTAGYSGTKIDVTKGGIYYTKGTDSAKTAAQRDVADNELVVKKDIASLAGGMHFIGVGTIEIGETIEQAIAKIYAAKGKSYADKKAGDIVIIKYINDDTDQEFIYDGSAWVELGNQGMYATKAALETEKAEREEADAGKLDLMPGDQYTGGNAYNLPYYFYTVPAADKVSVHTKTVTLDGNKTQGDYSLDVVAATTTNAGLMAAADKTKLDGINTLTEAEIKDICK